MEPAMWEASCWLLEIQRGKKKIFFIEVVEIKIIDVLGY
jgi:hypothetical protein